MSDDLFAQLLELFNQPGPVNWKLAGEVAKQLTGPAEPIDPWLAEEYQELTRLAQLRVAESTNLPIPEAIAANPIDRAGWAQANLRSLRYLVEPLAAKLADQGGEMGPLDAVLRPLVPALLGMQMGVMVGFLSRRVLGQFDVGLPAAEQSELYLVVPNVESFAADNGLDPRQVRLWVALHEVTHQAEFAQPWTRTHLVRLVTDYLDGLDLDPAAMSDKLQGLQDPEQLQRLLDDPAGLAGLIGSEAQRPLLEAIQAFMAVMEGYADFLMDRAAPGLLPDLARMREAIDRRRSEPSQGEQLLNRLLGLEMKHRQYELGARFCQEIVRRWGEHTLDVLWEAPDRLPSLAELEDPVAWAARVLLD